MEAVNSMRCKAMVDRESGRVGAILLCLNRTRKHFCYLRHKRRPKFQSSKSKWQRNCLEPEHRTSNIEL